jgi:hypothetical protein
MKLKILIICLSFLVLKSFGQDAAKIFDEVKNVTVRNMGAITKNNVVKGYFAFYEYDKVDKHTLLYKLSLMDENLNELGTKDIEGPKDWVLISSAYDGNNFCFKFYDEKAKTIELKVYDDQAKEVATNTIDLNYKPSNSKAASFSGLTNPELNVVDSNGFVDYTFNDPNDSYIISYANGLSKKTWQSTYEPEGKSKIMVPNFLAGDNEMVLTAVSRLEKGLGNNKTENSIVANNIKNGGLLFDITTEIDDNHVVPINAIFDGDKITIVGLNYKTAKTYTRPPDGFAFIEIDRKGKILKKNFKTFEETLGKYLPMEGSQLNDGYYLFIHNIVRTKNNTNLVIAEKFKKAADAVGVGLMALSMLSGGHGNVQFHSDGIIKLMLENMVVIEYDMDGNVIQAKEVPKGKGSTGVIPGSSTQAPYTLATMANMFGWMDYMFTLKNEDKSEITFNFVDYDKLDVDAKKTKNFGQIKYKDGAITVDKIPIKNQAATFSHLFPAKTGYVMQMNYFKKDKKLTMAFIKLNN